MTAAPRSVPLLARLGHLADRLRRTPRALRWSVGGLALLVLAFGLLGHFWLPGFAKEQLETRLGELLHRQVTVRAVAVQPFRLAVAIQGLRIAEREAGGVPAPDTAAPPANTASEPLLAFDELRVNL